MGRTILEFDAVDGSEKADRFDVSADEAELLPE